MPSIIYLFDFMILFCLIVFFIIFLLRGPSLGTSAAKILPLVVFFNAALVPNLLSQIWLPSQDSNLNQMVQSHPCYHYTTGQCSMLLKSYIDIANFSTTFSFLLFLHPRILKRNDTVEDPPAFFIKYRIKIKISEAFELITFSRMRICERRFELAVI